jgi:hypothetical protein
MGELYMAESQTGEEKRIFRVSEKRASRGCPPQTASSSVATYFIGR